MRRQSGTTDLRALLYMDEVAGYLPPTADPPTKKPIMTLMKQARAFGVGVVLATQNPVDVDYKAISNAGTWMIGRLQTERDKQRLLDGMSAAERRRRRRRRRRHDQRPGQARVRAAPGRQGPARGVHDPLGDELPPRADDQGPDPPAPAGRSRPSRPLRRQPTRGGDNRPGRGGAGRGRATEPTPAPGAGGSTTPVMPTVASGIDVRWIDAAAPGVRELGGDPAGQTLVAAIVAEVQVRYDDTKLALTHDVTFTLGGVAPADRLDPAQLADVPVDVADLLGDPPPGCTYRISGGPIGDAPAWKQLQRDLVDHLVRTRPCELMVNKQLGLASQPGESAEDFRGRCAAAAQERIDADQAKLEATHQQRSARLADRRDAAADRAEVVQEQAADRKRGNWMKAAGDVLGGILGSRRRRGGQARAGRRPA